MYIYAFGSVCRGEIDRYSDVDLLAIVETQMDTLNFNKDDYSIYSESRIRELWDEGNPFAWHLSIESKLIFSSTGKDLIKNLGTPSKYKNCTSDCKKFQRLFEEAFLSLKNSCDSSIFDLSTVFLAIRNFATCYSLGIENRFNFSRDSALKLESHPLKIKSECYDILKRSRILSTRGKGENFTYEEIIGVKDCLLQIKKWFEKFKIN